MLLKDREFKIMCQPKIGTIVLLLLNPNLMKCAFSKSRNRNTNNIQNST